MPEWAEVRYPDPPSGDTPKLRHLLAAIESVGSKLDWLVRHVEGLAYGSEDWGRRIGELERAADQTDEGVPISWDGLIEIAAGVEQLLECRFDGLTRKAVSPEADNGEGEIEVVIQAMDGSTWSICTRDPAVLHLITSKYPPVREGSVAAIDEYLEGPGNWG